MTIDSISQVIADQHRYNPAISIEDLYESITDDEKSLSLTGKPLVERSSQGVKMIHKGKYFQFLEYTNGSITIINKFY